jgi:hypothetical protein
MRPNLDIDTEKLIQALEQKFPNGGWKKYVRIAGDEDRIEYPNYGKVAYNAIAETKDQSKGNSIA